MSVGTYVHFPSKLRTPLATVTNAPSFRYRDPLVSEDIFQAFENAEPLRCEVFEHVEFRLGQYDVPADVVEYENIIYRTMRANEYHNPQMVVPQPEITSYDRGMVIDWLCRIHYKCQSTTVAFYRCCTILDRVLFSTTVPLSSLKLIGAAAYYIASKVDDIYHADMRDICEIAGNEFTVQELLSAEIEVLNIVGFSMTFPTTLFFLQYFLRIHRETPETELLARYLCEICTSSEYFIGKPASEIAAAAIMIKRVLCKESPWTEELEAFTQYTFEDLMDDAVCIHSMLLEEDRPQTSFMRRKYGSKQFRYVALVVVPEELPDVFYQ